MTAAIRVTDLGKSYRIHHGVPRGGYHTLRESLVDLAKAPVRRLRRGGGQTEEFWALKGVDFEVQHGEVVGIIGRNGAGKSTLLKIFSRITKPTTGRVELHGRVGSLLEVGTGFHPELTGRENIFLNGSILGMSRREITRQFDEIVAFAEVERFLNTPVKKYSSGMYVRLAFAVAAHLEPEILIVDEVLAVGDQAFQRKCLGKMRDVAGEGRTVLFVTHNMQVVQDLCSRVILIDRGRIQLDGGACDVTQHYLCMAENLESEVAEFSGHAREKGHGLGVKARLESCQLNTAGRPGPRSLSFGDPICLKVEVTVNGPLESLELGLGLCSFTGFEITSTLSRDALDPRPVSPGRYVFLMKLPDVPLIPGRYFFGLGLRSDRGLEDHIQDAFCFEVLPSPESANLLVQTRRGVIVPRVECVLETV
jgi:lipopolysaccharide transport system ATP-binding protein